MHSMKEQTDEEESDGEIESLIMTSLLLVGTIMQPRCNSVRAILYGVLSMETHYQTQLCVRLSRIRLVVDQINDEEQIMQ